MKTNELIGPALDWAVAKAGGFAKIYNFAPQPGDDDFEEGVDYRSYFYISNETRTGPFMPSTRWAEGGPIIERERISLSATPSADFHARTVTFPPVYLSGPTPLIAAMRCYVASKLGDDIDIPAELMP